jgi:hypothetical protein
MQCYRSYVEQKVGFGFTVHNSVGTGTLLGTARDDPLDC